MSANIQGYRYHVDKATLEKMGCVWTRPVSPVREQLRKDAMRQSVMIGGQYCDLARLQADDGMDYLVDCLKTRLNMTDDEVNCLLNSFDQGMLSGGLATFWMQHYFSETEGLSRLDIKRGEDRKIVVDVSVNRWLEEYNLEDTHTANPIQIPLDIKCHLSLDVENNGFVLESIDFKNSLVRNFFFEENFMGDKALAEKVHQLFLENPEGKEYLDAVTELSTKHDRFKAPFEVSVRESYVQADHYQLIEALTELRTQRDKASAAGRLTAQELQKINAVIIAVEQGCGLLNHSSVTREGQRIRYLLPLKLKEISSFLVRKADTALQSSNDSSSVGNPQSTVDKVYGDMETLCISNIDSFVSKLKFKKIGQYIIQYCGDSQTSLAEKTSLLAILDTLLQLQSDPKNTALIKEYYDQVRSYKSQGVHNGTLFDDLYSQLSTLNVAAPSFKQNLLMPLFARVKTMASVFPQRFGEDFMKLRKMPRNPGDRDPREEAIVQILNDFDRRGDAFVNLRSGFVMKRYLGHELADIVRFAEKTLLLLQLNILMRAGELHWNALDRYRDATKPGKTTPMAPLWGVGVVVSGFLYHVLARAASFALNLAKTLFSVSSLSLNWLGDRAAMSARDKEQGVEKPKKAKHNPTAPESADYDYHDEHDTRDIMQSVRATTVVESSSEPETTKPRSFKRLDSMCDLTEGERRSSSASRSSDSDAGDEIPLRSSSLRK